MLLTQNDDFPVLVTNPQGKAPFLLIGDHAGRAVPERLASLGLAEAELARHIGWDIGIRGLGEALAARLDAVFLHQAYSRLVVDCNRAPSAIDAIAAVSDATPVPGNADLAEADRAARFEAIHEPYHQAIAAEIARRDAAGQPTILVALHSFTPVMRGDARPWQAGILHDGGDVGFALAVLALLRADPALTVGDNEPYRMDSIDYTIPRHAYPARRPYVEIEIRQDLLGEDAGIATWAERLAVILPRAAEASRAA